MPLPADWNLITVTGKYLRTDGTPVQGSVSFTISQRTTLPADLDILIPETITVNLDITGALSVQLPATDDPDISPTGLSYTVVESFTNGVGSTYQMALLLLGPNPFDLSLVPVVAPASGSYDGGMVA